MGGAPSCSSSSHNYPFVLQNYVLGRVQPAKRPYHRLRLASSLANTTTDFFPELHHYQRTIPEVALQEELRILNRRTLRDPNLVGVCAYHLIRETNICKAASFTASIYTEPLLLLLSDFSSAKDRGQSKGTLPPLGFDEAVYVLISSLHGYQLLSQYGYLCYPNAETVGFSKDAQVKVWIHSNIAENSPQQQASKEEAVVEELLDLIGDRMAQPFSLQIRNKDYYGKNFDKMQSILSEFLIDFHRGKQKIKCRMSRLIPPERMNVRDELIKKEARLLSRRQNLLESNKTHAKTPPKTACMQTFSRNTFQSPKRTQETQPAPSYFYKSVGLVGQVPPVMLSVYTRKIAQSLYVPARQSELPVYQSLINVQPGQRRICSEGKVINESPKRVIRFTHPSENCAQFSTPKSVRRDTRESTISSDCFSSASNSVSMVGADLIAKKLKGFDPKVKSFPGVQLWKTLRTDGRIPLQPNSLPSEMPPKPTVLECYTNPGLEDTFASENHASEIEKENMQSVTKQFKLLLQQSGGQQEQGERQEGAVKVERKVFSVSQSSRQVYSAIEEEDNESQSCDNE